MTELELKIEKLNNELQHHRAQMGESTSNSSQSPVQTGGSHAHSSPNHQFSPMYQQNTLGQRSSLSSTPVVSAIRGSGNKRKKGAHGGFEFVNETEGFKMNKTESKDKSNKKVKLTKCQQIDELIGSNALSEVSTAVTQIAENRLRRLHTPHIDLIDQGLLTLEEAQQRLDLYFDTLFAKYPFVDAPRSVETLRVEYPVLFNVIMAVSCVVNTSPGDFDKNLDIENIANQQVINEVIIIGNKSIELLKSLLLLTVWYNMPELFHHRRYHIFSALCITMTQDLGLTGRPYYVVNKTEGSFRRSAMLEDPQKDEYKCLVLAVYASSIGYSLFLRRKLFVTWTPYMEESYQQLRNSEELRYRSVAVFAKLSSLLEKIHSFVEAKDQENLSFIQHFQKAIDYLKDQQTTMDSGTLLGFAYSVEAFLYSKFTSYELSYKCLHSTIRCLEHFSSLSPEEFGSIPLLIYGRLMFCFALLLKTSNYLNIDFDFQSVKGILNTLDECNKIYKTNHLLLKTKLLFYFYLTTYAKNVNAFNELATVSSTETAVQVNSEHSSVQGTPTNTSYTQQVIPQNNTVLTDIPSNSSQQIPLNGAMNHVHNLQHTYPDQTPSQSSNLIQPHFQPQPHQLPPQQHQPQHHQQQPMMVQNPGYSNMNFQNRGLVQPLPENIESHMEPIYPQLDVLSDATMKGFGDIPTELMGQDEFWKLFDYKDDQFLL